MQAERRSAAIKSNCKGEKIHGAVKKRQSILSGEDNMIDLWLGVGQKENQ